MKTKSEALFERFLNENSLPICRLGEDGTPMPDYSVPICGSRIIFEVKELREDGGFDAEAGQQSREVGKYIRQVIRDRRTRRRAEQPRPHVRPGSWRSARLMPKRRNGFAKPPTVVSLTRSPTSVTCTWMA